MIEKEQNIKKGKKYLIIGVLVLFLAVLGSSVAYYLARVSGSLSGNAAGTGLSLTIDMVSDTDGDLIPLDNDVETLNQAILGYGNTSNNFDSAKACLDINNYSVCQVYKVTLTNNGTVQVTVNSNVTLSGANTPNIDCTTMDDEKSVSNNNSCIGDNTLANNDTINGNSSKDYYVVVYIKNLDEPQYDSGEFNGTITFTSTQGDQVKGRFKQGDTLVQHITKLYNNNKNTTVTNNNIEYQYATSVNLMNDRLGGTTTSLDGGNIRYYGAEPNNWIDIGDKTKVAVEKGNWEKLEPGAFESSDACNTFVTEQNWTDDTIKEQFGELGFNTIDDLCGTETIEAGSPILWRIIGVFDGKARIVRSESIGLYSFDTSADDVNNGNGINEWSQSDIMKLLNPGYENNQGFDSDGTTKITVNNSLYWNNGSGKCYNSYSYSNTTCDFTSSGLSDEAKEFVIDQTVYLGGFDTRKVFVNEAYAKERGNNVFYIGRPDSAGDDTVTRTLSWTGKVALIYPSDFGYAEDFTNADCQDTLDLSNCDANWMLYSKSWVISPWSNIAYYEFGFDSQSFYGGSACDSLAIRPTLTLDPSLLFDDTTDGSKNNPYKIVD